MDNYATRLYVVMDTLLAILSMLFPVILFFLTGEIQYSITRYLRITAVAPIFYFYSIVIILLIFIKFALKYKVVDFIYVVIFCCCIISTVKSDLFVHIGLVRLHRIFAIVLFALILTETWFFLKRIILPFICIGILIEAAKLILSKYYLIHDVFFLECLMILMFGTTHIFISLMYFFKDSQHWDNRYSKKQII